MVAICMVAICMYGGDVWWRYTWWRYMVDTCGDDVYGDDMCGGDIWRRYYMYVHAHTVICLLAAGVCSLLAVGARAGSLPTGARAHSKHLLVSRAACSRCVCWIAGDVYLLTM